MKCQRTECEEEATHHPCICVPGTDLDIATTQPLRVTIGAQLCKSHAKRFDYKEWFKAKTPNGNFTNEIIFVALARRGPAPDFARAWVMPIRTDHAGETIFNNAQKALHEATEPNQSVSGPH